MADRISVLDQAPAPEPPPGSPPGRRRRWAIVVGAVVVAVVVLGGLLVSRRHGDPGAVPPRLPTLGPAHDVYDGDLGDPFVLAVNLGGKVDHFVAFGTGDWPARVPTASSADLAGWKEGGDALPQLPPWAALDPRNSLSWAPAALQLDDRFLLYVTLPDAASGQQCIGAATATVAEGPYANVGDGPLLCQHELGGSIDPAVARDRSGRLHMLWKNDGNSVGAPSSLWEQRLSADGLGLVGSPHRLLTASQPWQGGIVEEPALLPAADGGWWLFYSGNFFDRPEYAVGVAYCPQIEGPCREAGDGPFLATGALQQDRQFAPGGLETFRDARGGTWAVFDTWNRPTRNGRFYCCRSLQLAPVLSG